MRPEEQSALLLCLLRYLLFKISSRAVAALDAEHGETSLEADIHREPLYCGLPAKFLRAKAPPVTDLRSRC